MIRAIKIGFFVLFLSIIFVNYSYAEMAKEGKISGTNFYSGSHEIIPLDKEHFDQLESVFHLHRPVTAIDLWGRYKRRDQQVVFHPLPIDLVHQTEDGALVRVGRGRRLSAGRKPLNQSMKLALNF